MAVRWHRPTRVVNLAIQQIQADQMVSSCDRNKLMGISPYVLGLVLMWCVLPSQTNCKEIKCSWLQKSIAVMMSDLCDEISKSLTCI
jgi:hypothetical protein